MKKTIIVLAITLTSGIAALALSNNKTNNEVKIAQVKADRDALVKSNDMGNYKSDVATAD